MAHHAPRRGQALTEAGRAEAAEKAAALEAGRRLFAGEVRFVFAATDAGGLPAATLPEVAFAGRSNVGKSSLINALAGRKGLARISNTPGRTRQLNFFDLGGKLLLVDMPGYGYAKVSKSETAAWQRLIGAYLRGRASLKRLMLLVDARHGLKESDREMMGRLDEAAVGFQLVLTKSDQCSEAALAACSTALAGELARHPAGHPETLPTSAAGGRGIPELRAVLAALAGGRQFG